MAEALRAYHITQADIAVAKKYYSQPLIVRFLVQVSYRLSMLALLVIYIWGALVMLDLILHNGAHWTSIPLLFFFGISFLGCSRNIPEVMFGPDVLRRVAKCALETNENA